MQLLSERVSSAPEPVYKYVCARPFGRSSAEVVRSRAPAELLCTRASIDTPSQRAGPSVHI
eukprot:2751887-Pleurochrysis_carterae.AAC.1